MPRRYHYAGVQAGHELDSTARFATFYELELYTAPKNEPT